MSYKMTRQNIKANFDPIETAHRHSKNAYNKFKDDSWCKKNKKKYYRKTSENKEVERKERAKIKDFKRTTNNNKKKQKRKNLIDEQNKYDFIYLGDSENLFLAFPVKTWFFNRFLTRKSKKSIHKFLMDNRKTFGFNFKDFMSTYSWYYKNTDYDRINQCGYVVRFNYKTSKKAIKIAGGNVYFVIRVSNDCKQQKFIFDTKYIKNIFIIDNSLFKTEKIPIEHERVRRFEKIYISHDPLMVSKEFLDYLVDKWCIVDHFNKRNSVFVFSKK